MHILCIIGANIQKRIQHEETNVGIARSKQQKDKNKTKTKNCKYLQSHMEHIKTKSNQKAYICFTNATSKLFNDD